VPDHLQLAFRSTPESYGRMGEGEEKPTVVPLRGEDHPLFARAYREHYPALHAFLRRRVGTDAEAADIAQEAYLRVLRYRDQQDVGVVKTLLFRIAVNLLGIRARVARTHRWSDHVPLDDDLPLEGGEPSQDRQAASEQQLARVLEVVNKLPRRCQEVFVLSRFQGLGRQEVGQILNLSMASVDKYIAMALTALRKRLGDEW
jgi:RNA polymerase sigma factor (sigma-70 family)